MRYFRGSIIDGINWRRSCCINLRSCNDCPVYFLEEKETNKKRYALFMSSNIIGLSLYLPSLLRSNIIRDISVSTADDGVDKTCEKDTNLKPEEKTDDARNHSNTEKQQPCGPDSIPVIDNEDDKNNEDSRSYVTKTGKENFEAKDAESKNVSHLIEGSHSTSTTDDVFDGAQCSKM